MPSLQEVFKNTTAQFFGRSFSVLVSVVLTAYLAREQGLGKSGYGEYSFITAFVLLFGTVADWGTNIITVREASQNPAKQPVIFGSILFFRLALSLAAAVTLFVIAVFVPQLQKLLLPITVGSLVLIFLSFKTSLGIVFQTLLRFSNSALVEIASSLSFLILVLLFFQFSKNVLVVIFCWLLATIISSSVAFMLVRKIVKISCKLDFGTINRVFKESLSAGALFVVFTIYNRVDVIILQAFKGSLDVGSYSLAYKVHDNLVYAAAFLMNSVFPYLASSFANKDYKAVRYHYQKMFDLLLILGGAAVFVISLAAPLIVLVLGGSQYPESVDLVRILVLATFVAFLNHLTGYSLIAFGKQRTSLLIAIGALILNIIANLIFVPLYSYKASAWTTVATEGFVLVLSTFAIAKAINKFPSLFSFAETIKEIVVKRTIRI